MDELPNGIRSYVAQLQNVQCCRGLATVHRVYASTLPSHRSVMRWFKQYPNLVIFPSFTLEALGLVHVHLFVRVTTPRWLRFRYGVDARWVTDDLVRPILYILCVVPREHLQVFLAAVRRAGAMHAVVTWSGWQSFPGNTVAADRVIRNQDQALLRRHPLIVPVLCEHWQRRGGLGMVWLRVRERLGQRLRQYLPRQRIHRVNGKHHVKEALAALEAAGLFRQYVVSHHAWAGELEFVILGPGVVLDELLRQHGSFVRVSTRFRGEERDIVLVIATRDFLLACWAQPVQVFLVNSTLSRPLSEHFRFAYEDLFDPVHGKWEFKQPFRAHQ